MSQIGARFSIALLADTPVSKVRHEIHSFDHALIFSGNLGFHGGSADLSLLKKAKEIRQLDHEIEIGGDGGINADNAADLVHGGVTVLNVGGYVQKSDDPQAAYATLKEVTKNQHAS